MILKARLDIVVCSLLVNLHEWDCTNVETSFLGINHAVGESLVLVIDSPTWECQHY